MELDEHYDASLQRAHNVPLGRDSDGPATLISTDYEKQNQQQETQLSLASQPETHTQIRLQLRQCFFDIHFGGNASPPPMFVHIVSETGIQIKALEAGMDALCVAQLATTMRDERLGRTSSLLYSIAIRQLSHELQRFVSNDMSGSTLAQIIKAIDVLISCSWFKCIAAGPGDWNRHMVSTKDSSPSGATTEPTSRQACWTSLSASV